MTLWKATWKDIVSTFMLVFGHWCHRKYIELTISIFGKNRIRDHQLKIIMKREQHLKDTMLYSSEAIDLYRAQLKAGFDPDNLPEI